VCGNVGDMKKSIKVRKSWGILKPYMRVVGSGKVYNRKKKFKKSVDVE